MDLLGGHSPSLPASLNQLNYWSFAMIGVTPALLLLASTVQAAPWLQARTNGTDKAWTVDQFKNFIVFGDSYSDESRLGYFSSHNGSAPPTGTLLPESFDASDGGRIWARYVVQYTNEALTLYDYAVSGAVCSNQITPRFFSQDVGNFPDIDGYEVPAFLADKAQDVNVDTGGPYFDPALSNDNAVYAFFIGTNDIGVSAFLQDAQLPGNTLTDYVDCVYTQMDRVYASGARYFVLFNVAPLQLTALYANASEGGEAPSEYWNDRPDNLTDISERMTEFTTTLNTVFDYKTPVEVLLNNRYPGAKVALYDVNQLVRIIEIEMACFRN
ncbi:MAG: hypothetical protein Q9159_000091 [Coniocarpon cinnabarinum]